MTDEAGSLPEELLERTREAIEDRHGYLSWLGIQVETLDPGRAVLTIPFDTKLSNATEPPSMHGGVAATLIDTAGAMALRTTLEDPDDGHMATINLNVNYLRPAMDDLVANAEVIRAGNTVGVATITVESETPGDGIEPVATGQAAYRMFRGQRRQDRDTDDNGSDDAN